jgi:L-histidine Nalpha-methyltransferase
MPDQRDPSGPVVAVEDDAGLWDDGAAVASCLREDVPRVPPWLGYDDLGSALFECITRLPTYYLTRVERGLLERHAAEMAEALDCPRVVELGSGSAEKTTLLLERCQRLRPTTYLPIDVSRAMLDRSAATLVDDVPGLRVVGLWGRYEAGLARVRADAEPAVILMIGSNLGNTTPGERATLLDEIASALRPGDGFLLSVDLVKPAEQFDRCYNDPPGESAFARFRLNHLTQLNRRFGSAFEIDDFHPRAHYDVATAVVEGHLYTRSAQRVPVPGLDLTVSLRPGGSINVGFSAKFDRDALVADLAGRGLHQQAEWVDERWAYAMVLFRKR